MAPRIQNSGSSSWSSLANHALLTARQNFPSSSFPSNSDHDSGLHPAAIFGIVAGVMFFIIIVSWIVWFTLIKKALTHREYGILPSIRTAANGHGRHSGNNNNNNYPHYGQDQSGAGSYGYSTTQYPPAAVHHDHARTGNVTPPPYDWNRHAAEHSSKDENRGHDTSHGMSNSGNRYSGPN